MDDLRQLLDTKTPRQPRYYEALNEGHDWLLRCKDCQALIVMEHIKKYGACSKCGNKRFSEITLLTEEEMARITSGELAFPHSAEFLAEFQGVE